MMKTRLNASKMSWKSSILYGFVLFFLVGGLSTSCRSLRVTEEGLVTEKDIKKVIDQRLGERESQKYLLAENISFEYIGETTVRGRLTLFAERDLRLFVSVKMLGFEVIRAEILKDSVRYINRLRKEYYFGPYKERDFDYFSGMEFKDIMDFLYTGFIHLPHRLDRSYVRNFEIRENKIVYDKVLSEGRRVINSYSLSELKLTESLISDYSNKFLAEIRLDRNYGELEEIKASYSLKGSIGEIKLVTGKIKNEKYTKTDFRLGKNYEKLDKLF